MSRLIFCTLFSIAMFMTAGCSQPTTKNMKFSKNEQKLIQEADKIMRVLTIESAEDLEILRAKSTDLPKEELSGETYKTLADLMIATVTHPSQNGVGIAAPQVGINRRVVAVQRFDKENEPFELYPNIRIVWKSEAQNAGPEGCLSVPDRRGEVMRSQEIIIEYADVTRLDQENYMVQETITGFTAVIFQHEVDHLDGVLYIDKL